MSEILKENESFRRALAAFNQELNVLQRSNHAFSIVKELKCKLLT